MFRPYIWAIFRLLLDFRISYTGMCGAFLGVLGEGGRWRFHYNSGCHLPTTNCRPPDKNPGIWYPLVWDLEQPPSPRTPQEPPHTFLYNWSESPVTTWRWPTYRAETCRYKPPVILEANIVVFDCKYYTPSSLITFLILSSHLSLDLLIGFFPHQNPVGTSPST